MGQQGLNRGVRTRKFTFGQHSVYLSVAYAVKVNRLAPTFAFGYKVVCISLRRGNKATAQGTRVVC